MSESSGSTYQRNQSTSHQARHNTSPQTNHRQDNHTTTTGFSFYSWNATSISSTHQARFHELVAILKRQKKDHEKLSKITDDRLSQMERQFSRLQDIETSVKESMAAQEEQNGRLRGLENRVVQFMESQVDTGNNVLSIEEKINELILIVNSLVLTNQRQTDLNTNGLTTNQQVSPALEHHFRQPNSILDLVDTDMASNPSTSSEESISFQSTCSFQSPEKKKVKSTPPSQSRCSTTGPTNEAHESQSPEQHLLDPHTHSNSQSQTSTPSRQKISDSELDELSADLAARYIEKAPGGGTDK